MRIARWRCTVVFVLGALLPVQAAEATDLSIQVRASDGRPAIVETAQLLLAAWGEVERIPLTYTFDANGVVIHVPLDADWLRSRWEHANEIESAFIYLDGRDFVSLRSDPFPWLGIAVDPGEPPRSDVTIGFGQGQRITVHEGESANIIVNVRRTPAPHQLKVIDDDGRPVSGVVVSAHMLWSTSNHCGVLIGKDTLVEGVRADADGIVAIPDGDFPYAIEVFTAPHEAVRDPDVDANGVIQTYLKERERIVRIHRFTRQPLSLRVLVGGKPVASPQFSVTLRGNGCGDRTGLLLDYAGSGSTASRVRDGEVAVENFFPEEIEAVCLGDAQGKTIWTMTEFDGKPVTVRLPAGTSVGVARGCRAH